MFWTTEHFQCVNCANPQKYLLSFELVCHCLAHIQLVHSMFWTREHIECSNPQKCVCQALNHCFAHIELVHSLFSTTSPTRQLPAVRSLLCLFEMDLMKNVKKNKADDQDDDYADCSQSYRCVSFMPGVTQARLTFITLPPGLQCTQWSIIIHITTSLIIVLLHCHTCVFAGLPCYLGSGGHPTHPLDRMNQVCS